MSRFLVRPHHRLAVPRVALLWAVAAAAVLAWYPHSPHLVHFASTSLANLATHPMASLVLSLVTTTHGWGEWVTWVGLAVVWAAIEFALGWRKALVTFVAGHVLATIGLAAVEAFAVWSHLAGHGLAHVTDDVGASYGFLALATAGLTLAIRHDRRWWLGAPAIAAISVIDVSGWTMVGHAMAISIGVVLGFELLMRRRAGAVAAAAVESAPLVPARV